MLLNIIRVSGMKDKDICNVFRYGSRVYGTDRPSSDHDFIVVGKTDNPHQEIRNGELNLHILTPEIFQDLLYRHKIHALECYFLSQEHRIIDNRQYDWKLNKPALRHEFSQKASNSFVKAKKKLTVEPEDQWFIGVKSLWHSWRIVHFGMQIAESGKLFKYNSMNHYWDMIYDEWFLYDNGPSFWDDKKEVWQMKYNSLMTGFRQVCPKK